MTPEQSFEDRVDSVMTPWRRKVKDLQTQRGIGASEGCFNCDHFKNCSESIKKKHNKKKLYKGDWTYVGRQYGRASVSGKRAKILFVSMERPGDREHEEFETTQKEFREGAFCWGSLHMSGVDVQLEYLIDEETAVNRCQQFALTNSVRCHPPSRTSRSKSTREMISNCAEHTKAIVEALYPDIVIVQGRDRDCGLEATILSKSRVKPIVELGSAKVRGKEVLILHTAHPAYPGYRGFRGRRGLPAEMTRLFKRAKEMYAS